MLQEQINVQRIVSKRNIYGQAAQGDQEVKTREGMKNCSVIKKFLKTMKISIFTYEKDQLEQLIHLFILWMPSLG